MSTDHDKIRINLFFYHNINTKENVFFFQRASWKRYCATLWWEQVWTLIDNGLAIFDWFVLSMRMQVILDSLLACPGSAPIWGGKKGEFRDWTNRSQAVFINCLLSKQEQIKCGLPQGLILVQLLFLIYINDLSSMKHLATRKYTDDTNLTFTPCSIPELQEQMRVDIQCLENWLIANRWTLNTRNRVYVTRFKTKNCHDVRKYI